MTITRPIGERFSLTKLIGILAIHGAALWGLRFISLRGLALIIFFHVLVGGLGVSVGYHRLPAHRSFTTGPVFVHTLGSHLWVTTSSEV